MLENHKFVGKNEEEALALALKTLECSSSDILYSSTELSGGLFKTKKIELNVIKKDDIKEEIKTFIKSLKELMNIDMNIEVKEINDIYNILIVSENNSILIGKDGRTLNSIQSILRTHISKITGLNIHINIDISNYKKKKVRNIEFEIRKIAKEVNDSGIEAKLDPMNSYNRRIVHTVVSEFESLKTVSVGEEPERYVIISKK